MTAAGKMPNVMIGMPVGSGHVPWPTATSLISTIRALDREGIKFKLESPMGSSIVQWARSGVVHEFLKSDCTHLMWIDSDIVFTPSDFLRLLGFGAVLDVVGATYPFKTDGIARFCLNAIEEQEGQFEVNGLGCVKMKSFAMGFSLIKRRVIEKIAEDKAWMEHKMNGYRYRDFFRVDRSERGEPRGEDIAFFDDVRAAGFDVWLDPSIKLGHVGMKVFRGDPIEALGLEDFAKEIKAP